MLLPLVLFKWVLQITKKMSKKELSKADMDLLKEVANKLPVFPKLDEKGELLYCRYSVMGKDLIAQGQTHIHKESTIKGPNRGITRIQRGVAIDPTETYLQTGYHIMEPLPYLVNAIKKQGPTCIEAVTKKYLAMYEASQKKIADLNTKKDEPTQAPVSEPSGVL